MDPYDPDDKHDPSDDVADEYEWRKAEAELCTAQLRTTWDEFPVNLRCERDAGHRGEHSAEDGEWAWGGAGR